MSVDERIPGYSDKELASLHENIVRLAQVGSIPQRAEAERLLPLVDAELAARKARAPVRASAAKKTAAKKAPAKSKAKKKKADADAEPVE